MRRSAVVLHVRERPSRSTTLPVEMSAPACGTAISTESRHVSAAHRDFDGRYSVTGSGGSPTDRPRPARSALRPAHATSRESADR